ncbi:RnfABCDGE type electron transport complex subunit D [Gulbenkiania mobilis]|uniref:RnfABCDGE type electron transport complex subunit D n=1 Tax=Gulbenkiania mobilis TaxID=397457 RepID=UPI0006BBDA4B|nr:RnfABCDGE type electron transport complex subunit D [Gulbenkiania mobilis]
MPFVPHATRTVRVSRVMFKVLLALVPAFGVYCWLWGAGVLVQLLLAVFTALLAEAAMLRLRGRPLAPSLGDGSALLTAALLALAMPPLGVWWLIVLATLFAIVPGKQLYGGLGHNPFNPAMVGFAAMIVSFPSQMGRWGSPLSPLSTAEQIRWIFLRTPPAGSFDALSSATPLDALKTGLLGGGEVSRLVASPLYGHFGGAGSEWLGLAVLVGGLWLWRQRIISLRAPLGLLCGLLALALPLWLVMPERFASPGFHVLTGATLLGAFFIVTDPVTGPTTPRGQWLFGFLVGALTYLIRVFGGYPDGLAFAVLIFNIAVPLIDTLTRPPAFGQAKGARR